MGLIGTGVYSIRQAARLVGAEPASVRRWLLGYERKQQRYEPLWAPELAAEDLGEPVLGFRDLLELRLVNAFVRHGVSLRVIRATADFARDEFGTPYPLTAKRFLTDGRTIFLEAVRSAGEDEMLDVSRRQFVFSDIVRPSIYSGIEYSDDGGHARRWFPLGPDRKLVVLDPAVQFGAPIVNRAGVPTDTIYSSYLAEGKDRQQVARIFDIRPVEVDAAVRFEMQLAA